MGRRSLIVCCLVWIAVAVLVAGCTTTAPAGPATPAATNPASRYAAGDVLSGNMTLAGYDTPDPEAGRYEAVVIGYQPGTDTYVYTFVEPLANGSYRYVLPEEWTAKIGRSRQEFEAYGLVKNGTMSPDQVWRI